MLIKEVICKAHHDQMLQLILVHHDRTARAIKCHPWKLLKLAHRHPLRFLLPHVVVYLTRGDGNVCEIFYIVADTSQIALFEAVTQVKPPVDKLANPV
jgi:hypothetical protein